MLSYTGSRNLYGSYTQDTSSANLTHGDTLINLAIREILGKSEWDFMEKTTTMNTVASQQFYELPADYDTLINGPYVIVGNNRYKPKECPSRDFWDHLNMQENWSSDYPEWYFVFGGQLGLFPTPNTSISNGLVIPYKRGFSDLSIADYTTGTVDIITNGDETVTGSGTTWTSPMVGRFLRITPSNTAASSGDGLWYEIESRTSATVLELKKPYLGTSLTTGAAAAYTIGQMSPLPETYHELPILKAAEKYWGPKSDQRAKDFKQQYMELLQQMIDDHSSKTNSPVIDDGSGVNIINPNLTISL